MPAKAMGVVTEFVEAEAEFCSSSKSYDRHPFALELADIAIRILDIIEPLYGHTWCVRRARDAVSATDGILSNIWSILKPLANAVEEWRHENYASVMIRLEIALSQCHAVAACYGFDLPLLIEEKIKKNQRRGYLHGKKRKDF